MAGREVGATSGIRPASGQGAQGAANATTVSQDPVTTRLVNLVPGQQIQATVVAVHPEGRVTLGLLGGLVEATTALSLEPGRHYQFTVAALHPQIVLSTAKPMVLPSLTQAAASGALGLSGLEILPLMARLSAVLAQHADTTPALPSPGVTQDPGRRGASLIGNPTLFDPVSVWHILGGGGARAANTLSEMHRRFGHDHEARVLRLPADVTVAESAAAGIRLDGKALALRLQDHAPDPRRAIELVQALNGMERDNAARAEQGLPQWLPLPAFPAAGIRDARMFLRTEEGSHGPDAGQETGFTIVLLLDFSRLGPVRADLRLAGPRLTVSMVVADPATAQELRAALPGLTEVLSTAGLEVQPITIRLAEAGQLPVADLVHLQPGAANTALVDIHV